MNFPKAAASAHIATGDKSRGEFKRVVAGENFHGVSFF
jgi:hypothetical protein